MRRNTFYLAPVFLFISFASSAQDKEVRQVIDRFFEGMQLGDSSMVHQTVTNDVMLVSVFNNTEMKPVMVREPIKKFLDLIGTPHDQLYNEPTWNVLVKQDGSLAHVWCDYAFYLGSNFHHCGVDSFSLFKSEKGWKIFHITDTRRKNDCVIPEEVRRKFGK